jgi:hypothetical protein
MHRVILILIVVGFFSGRISAQETLDFSTVDKKTYGYYLEKKWDSLIYVGNRALNDSIDYFYLRLRLATAYYYKQNYIKAITECEKALNYNSSDEVTLQLLYYCYLYSGRESDARSIQSHMTKNTLAEIKAKKRYSIDNIYLESGISPNNNFSKNQNINFSGDTNLLGGVTMSGSSSYASLGIKAWIGNKISIYAAGSFAREQKKTIFNASAFKPADRIITKKDTTVWRPDPIPGYFTYDTTITSIQGFKPDSLYYSNDNTLNQSEIYLNCGIHAAKGLDIIPFVHLLNTRLTKIIPVFETHDYIATDFVDYHSQFHYPPPTGAIVDTVFRLWDTTYTVKTSDYKFHQKDTSFTNYSLGILVNKNIGQFSSSVFGSYSNLNGHTQKELGVSATWFPKGNLNLYFGTALTGYKQEGTKILVKKFLAGGKIWKKIWLEANATLGDMNNFTEKSGYVVNNNPDIVKYRIGITPMIFFKKFDIILHYQYQEKQGSYYYDNGSNPHTKGTFKYQNQLISGGIKWKL